MSEEVVGIKIKVGNEGFENIKELRQGLKAANDELLKAQTNFGNTSKEALAAAKKVAEFRDTIQEARETSDLFDPGKKFQAFTGALSAVAGGFSAVQGAIGLVGAESAEVEKTLLKVQSALALSQGLSTIADSAKDFQRLATVVKTNVVTAFSTLRGAIIATGIGALAVGLGLLVANFEKVKDTVFNLFPGLEKFTKLVGGLVQEFTDLVGITDEADRNLEKLEKSTKRGNETIGDRIKILSAQGGKEKEIYELSKQQGENELNFLRTKLKEKGKLSDEELKKFRDLKTEQAVLDEKEKKRLADIAKEDKKKSDDKSKEQKDKIAKDAEERAAAEKEAAKKISQLRGEAEVLGIKDEFEAKKKAIENTLAAEIQVVNENEKIKAETKAALIKALNAKADLEVRVAVKEQLDAQAKDTKEALEKQLEDERSLRAGQLQSRIELLDRENAAVEYDFEQDLERLAEKRDLLAEQEAIELANTELTEFQKFEIKKKYADSRNQLTKDEVATERAAAKAKVDIQMQYADYLQQFGALLTQVAGKSKALAIAGIVIEQGAALAKVIMQTSAANAAATAAAAPFMGNPVTAIPATANLARVLLMNNIQGGLSAAGIVAGAVKGISAINSSGVPGGSGGSAVSASSQSSAAPMSPPAPIQNTMTDLSQQSINQLGSATNRAYVVESDITNSQERITRINRAARLT
jgi:hypothetical protein